MRLCVKAVPLLEVVNDGAAAEGFEEFLYEFDVEGVELVGVLGWLVGEDEVEGDLIGLVHDGAVAGGHFAGVEVKRAGDGFEIFVHTLEESVGGGGIGGVGPKNDNVRKHS